MRSNAFARFISKSRVEPVGGGLVCLVFQLEDIVDFLLIHRPYGLIVQFLMINTGNGGSFVQL